MDQLVFGLRITRDASAGTYALLLFEYLTILDREVETIYKSRWSLPKCLYLACRFCPLLLWPIIMYGFMFDHDLETCKPFIPLITVLFVLFAVFPQFVYILRAWALTGAKRPLLLVYLPSLFGYMVAIFWHSLYGMVIWKDAFVLLGGKTGCFRAFPHGYNSLSRMLLASLALDGIIGIMIVIHFYQTNDHRTRLGRLLAEQGLLYFPLMFFLNVGGAVATSIGTFRGYDALVFSAVFSISNIMACRFMIQIREYEPMNLNSSRIMSALQKEISA